MILFRDIGFPIPSVCSECDGVAVDDPMKYEDKMIDFGAAFAFPLLLSQFSFYCFAPLPIQ